MTLVATIPVLSEYPSVEEMFACLSAFLRMASQATSLEEVNFAASAALSQLLGIPEG